MSGCFSSVSQVYRKRDRLDPGGDNRCDGAEHDRGCATSFAGGDCSFVAGEIAASQEIERVSLSRPAASERLATSISLAVGRRQRGAAGYETGADRRSAAVTRFANSRSRRCGSCISWAAATLNRETEHCEGPPAACDRCTGAVAPNRFPISEILPPRSRIPPQFRPSASPSNLETLLDRMAPSQTFWARCGC